MPVIHDRYRVIRELSATLYGWVFVCEDIHSTRNTTTNPSTVAVKQVSLDCMANFRQSHPNDSHIPDNPFIEKDVGNLMREAGGHPNLVQYKESFVEHQTLYLVMEYCADGDLHSNLSTRRQLKMPFKDALSVLAQVASGLKFLHDHGVAHRDISLENIMLHHGRCKLGDFGVATRAQSVRGRHVGKNYYMAPEIVAGDAYNPKAADIWSLGIVLFVMLTGSPLVSLASMSLNPFRAFKREGVVSVLQSWGVAESLPESAVLLLSGMLEVDPMRRLTITQVLEHDAFKESLDGNLITT